MEVYGCQYPPVYYPFSVPYSSDFYIYEMATASAYRDNVEEYYEMTEEIRQNRNTRDRRRSRSPSRSATRSKSESRSVSRSRSRSRSRSHSGSRSRSRNREMNVRDPTFLDAFRVMYLKPHKTKSNTTKFLSVQKRQDRVKEVLKQDGLGSKRWRFYPRPMTQIAELDTQSLPLTRETSDQRIKIDGNFFRKYKKSRKIDADSPVAKLKRWELLLYKRLGFVHAVDI